MEGGELGRQRKREMTLPADRNGRDMICALWGDLEHAAFYEF